MELLNLLNSLNLNFPKIKEFSLSLGFMREYEGKKHGKEEISNHLYYDGICQNYTT